MYRVPSLRAASEGLDKVSRVSVGEPNDLLDSLRDENEALLVRVAHLEATTDEYRRQMEGLLTSSSWRITAPLRSFAASVRLARRRIRQLPERLAPRPAPSGFCTTGLFHPEVPPPGGLVTAASPLLAHPELATDRQQPRLQGSPSDARVLVVAHVYHPEVWFDIEDRLVRIPEPYDLVVSLVEGRTEALEPEIAAAAATRDDPPRPEPRSRSRLARRVGRGRGLRRLRRDSQGAHQAQPAPG